jgi:mannobiose 2-epimerase
MDRLTELCAQVLQELTGNILPFWMQVAADRERGGFFGHIANNGTVQKQAPKGLVQHSRMLWTFSRAARSLADSEYRRIAAHALEALDLFWDDVHGGFFWMIDHRGQPLETDKLTYGQAFAIYALAESQMAGVGAHSLERAIKLYRLLEEHCRDSQHGGYWEARHADWTPAPGLCVDETPLPVAKGMNTHLHALEAYTGLLRAWNDSGLRISLQSLIEILLGHVLNRDTHHLQLFFDRDWLPLSDRVSYGHDIEASWLLVEAAEVLENPQLLGRTREAALRMAGATLGQGVDGDGGLFNEGDLSGPTDRTKYWWPQTEAIVGFLNAYQMSGDRRFVDASLASWHFAREQLVDRQHGEWFHSASEPDRAPDAVKGGPWKTPYHNARACLEVMRRVEELTNSRQRRNSS